MHPLRKSRLVLKNGALIGTLLIMPLHGGDYELKISFNNKLDLFQTFPRQFKGSIHEADFSSPTVTKNVPIGESLEISYVFEKRTLKIKQEGREESGILRIHFNVEHPINRHLFSLYFRDTSALTIVEPEEGDLILSNEQIAEPMVIVFSFINEEGNAFMDPAADLTKPGHQLDIDLGDFEHKILRVGAQTIALPEGLKLQFALGIPHSSTKMS